MTSLLLIHIITFSTSLVLMPLLLIASLTSFKVPKILRFGSLGATTIGLTSGSALLVASPSGAYCALLFSYVLIFGVLYIKSSTRSKDLAKATAAIDQ